MMLFVSILVARPNSLSSAFEKCYTELGVEDRFYPAFRFLGNEPNPYCERPTRTGSFHFQGVAKW